MQLVDLATRARHELTICNACRYCEEFCPVFPAIERRQTFGAADFAYLANLCHNCGECLYACQYAPPHEFGVNVPRTLAALRSQSYEEYCWPRWLGGAFRKNNLGTGLALMTACVLGLLALVWAFGPQPVWPSDGSADFYGVIPHGVMIAAFGSVGLFAVLAMGISCARFWRDVGIGTTPVARGLIPALRDGFTLRHLHGSGEDCTSDLDVRRPWRRWFHHFTLYGFLLCFASTTVAAFYHTVLGWHAPYGYTSAPVILGTLGGLGLMVGPAGLAVQRRRRDPQLTDADSKGLDASLLALLFVTSATGLALLVLRHERAMGVLLIVHLGSVLALFLTLPYGKFVHGLYRLLALVKYHTE